MDLSNSKVLIVDDTEENIDILVDLLEDDYKLLIASDGKTAIEIVEKNFPDIILLDIMMSNIDGYEVCKILKNNENTKNIPIIFLTALSQSQNEEQGLELGAVDYISKPINPPLVKVRIKNQLLLKRHQDDLENLVRERTKQLELTQKVIIKSMGTLAEYRDFETGEHIKRTQNYICILARYLNNNVKFKEYLNKENIELLFKSAPLHDIGKIGVSDKILLKPGKLTKEEFEKMKKHTIYGKDIIKSVQKELKGEKFLKYAEEFAYTHHEKWDGSGYPNGLKEEEIPISGRLMALADVYDTLTSKRVYKPAFSHEKSKSIILELKGKHFDPDVVDAFIELEDKFKEISMKNFDFNE